MTNTVRIALVSLAAVLVSPGWSAADDKDHDHKKKADKPKVEKPGVISGRVKTRWVKRFPAVVFLEKIKGKTFTPPKAPIVVDQEEKVFKPRVVPILVGTKVQFKNSDPFEHNVLSPKEFDLGRWGQGKSKYYVFKKAGSYTLLCDLHPEMIGYIVACDTPYFAITDKKGKFKIKNVPPGTYTIKTWHERLKPAKATVKVTAGGVTKVKLKPKKK